MSASSSQQGHRSFLVHKPINVLSSTVDPHMFDVVRTNSAQESDEKRRVVVSEESRLTVYDMARIAEFPTDLGLVGRLDCATSGVILFTSDSRLQRAILQPLDYDDEENGINNNNKDKDLTKERNNPVDNDTINTNTNTNTTAISNTLQQFKQKEYELKLLCPQKYKSIDELKDDLPRIKTALLEPFSFYRTGRQFHTNSNTQVEIIHYGQDPMYTKGRPDMGWTITAKVTLTEGKHHQIRRMATRNKFVVVSLKRLCIASILNIDSVPNPGDCRWLNDEEVQTLQTSLVEPFYSVYELQQEQQTKSTDKPISCI